MGMKTIRARGSRFVKMSLGSPFSFITAACNTKLLLSWLFFFLFFFCFFCFFFFFFFVFFFFLFFFPVFFTNFFKSLKIAFPKSPSPNLFIKNFSFLIPLLKKKKKKKK